MVDQLEAEIIILREQDRLAAEVRASGTARRWEEL
jgi:hypothetical protein